MASTNHASLRFSLLTALVWLLVASGLIFLLWTMIAGLSGRYLPVSTPTANLTQVYRTIAVILTDQVSGSASAGAPIATPSPTRTQRYSTPPPVTNQTITPLSTILLVTPGEQCDRAAAGNPIDITIPDDSSLLPGESFIKTWRLVNAGTCTWTAQYSASFFYGDRMAAPERVPLQRNVSPAQSVEISVELVAPASAGTYQGNWKLSNPDGDLFGIGPQGDSPFWVRIIVAGTGQVTPAPTTGIIATPTPTQEITATATAEGERRATLYLALGNSIDLDTLSLSGDDEDIIYQEDADGYHWLAPHEDALTGNFGSQEPTLAACQSTGMSAAPIAVENLSIGTYLCYLTEAGRLGYIHLAAINPDNFTLTLDLLTWPQVP